ncbi:hypothetical protein ACT4ML_01125 [Natrinema sp. LN54]|uniref:hypothetical protein n=1 Tax=Natrinema sp. LN54 TaxID=3458705 RepID=UPI004036AB94
MTVSFTKWLSQSISNFRETDKPLLSRVVRPIYYIYVAFLLRITKWYPYGTNIFERDWDALIILDACRVDALREVADEYEFLTVDDSITSVGSTSFEWMNHTFDAEYRDEIQDTAYVTGNGYTERVLGNGGDTGHAAMPFGPSEYDVVSPGDFGYLEELWRVEFDDSAEWMVGSEDGTRVHPRYTTDRAIAAGRNRSTDRLVVHYMYPHDPYPLADDPDLQEPFDALRAGRVDRDETWDEYLQNLRFVLDEVEVLLDNVDADNVVITADHGEAFGEYSFYRHVIGCPLPCMRTVPWAETTAADTGEYEPRAPAPQSATETATAEERLEDLGYL